MSAEVRFLRTQKFTAISAAKGIAGQEKSKVVLCNTPVAS